MTKINVNEKHVAAFVLIRITSAALNYNRFIVQSSICMYVRYVMCISYNSGKSALPDVYT